MIVNEGGKKLPKLTTPGTSADLLTGKELIDQYGRKIEGSMPINDREEPTFYTGDLETKGHITATAIYKDGYYDGGGFSNTYELPTQAGTTITPGTKTITAVPSGKYTLGAVEVAGDSDLVPENIKSGKTIFEVKGTYTGEYTRGYITSVSRLASNQLRFYTNITLKSNILGSVTLSDYNATGYTYSFIFNKKDFVYYGMQDQFGQFTRFPITDDIILYGIGTDNVSIGSNYFTITVPNPEDINFSSSIDFMSDGGETYKDGQNGRIIITYD